MKTIDSKTEFERARQNCLIKWHIREQRRADLKQAELDLSNIRLEVYRLAKELNINPEDIPLLRM